MKGDARSINLYSTRVWKQLPYAPEELDLTAFFDFFLVNAGFPLLTGIRGSAGVSRGPTEAITGPPRYISGVQPVMPGVQFGPLDPCRETPEVRNRIIALNPGLDVSSSSFPPR